MRYATVCSGIEAPSQAWHELGWSPVFFSEIEKHPSRVLAHHYPDVPNYGDMTKFKEWPDHAIDLLAGGTPCQSFSVAGLRKGLADPRGNLALVFLAIADRYRPNWLVWENVPGVLSSDGGRDFGAFLGGLAELGYGFAYRVLDAQFTRTRKHPWAVPQRRRRVFVVGYLGDWRRAAAVLSLPENLRWNPPPRREAGKGVAPTIASRPTGGGGLRTDFDCDGGLIAGPAVSPSLKARDCKGPSSDGDGDGAPLIAHSLRASGFDASEDGTGRGTPIVPIAFDTTQITSPGNYSEPKPGDPCHPLAARAHVPALAFQPRFARNGRGTPDTVAAPLTAQAGESGKGDSAQCVAFDTKGTQVQTDETGATPTLRSMSHDGSHANAGGQFGVATGWAVRRLTPLECERLQGFPDGYTALPKMADGPRYKMLGNSMAVNVMAWIGERIALTDATDKARRE